MVGVEIVEDKANPTPAPGMRLRIVQAAFQRGLILIGCGKSTIRLAPPLTVDEEDVDIAVGVLDEVIAATGA